MTVIKGRRRGQIACTVADDVAKELEDLAVEQETLAQDEANEENKRTRYLHAECLRSVVLAIRRVNLQR